MSRVWVLGFSLDLYFKEKLFAEVRSHIEKQFFYAPKNMFLCVFEIYQVFFSFFEKNKVIVVEKY